MCPSSWASVPHVVVLTIEVEKHVRMNIIGVAVGICAAFLPLSRKNINPPVGKSLLRNRKVFVSQGCKRCKHVLFRFIDCIFQIDAAKKRSIQIVVVKRVEASRILFKNFK